MGRGLFATLLSSQFHVSASNVHSNFIRDDVACILRKMIPVPALFFMAPSLATLEAWLRGTRRREVNYHQAKELWHLCVCPVVLLSSLSLIFFSFLLYSKISVPLLVWIVKPSCW